MSISDDALKYTPLHKVENAGKAKDLISKGADVNAPDIWLKVPLHYARNKDIAVELVKAGANVKARSKSGETPLHGVCDGETAKFLIENNADIEAQNKNGIRPLHSAKDAGVVNVLLDSGADIEAETNTGLTPLASAVTNIRFESAEALLKRGADPNKGYKERKFNPIHMSSQDLNYEMTELLLDYGADFTIKDKRGKTPKDYVVEKINDNPKQAKKLIKLFEDFEKVIREPTIKKQIENADGQPSNFIDVLKQKAKAR